MELGTEDQRTLRLPPTDRAREWLRHADPIPTAALDGVLARQRSDGSWGDTDDPWRRALPTLWTASVLAELGAAPTPEWTAAADFLSRHATTDDGVFSRDAQPSGVLACHVAIAASTYLRGGRRDLATPQVDWIVRYQDVRVDGRSPRGDVPVYHPGLAVRYGGCFAGTSCLVGVVKAGRALELWHRGRTDARSTDTGRTDPRPDPVHELLTDIRDALLARRLVHRSDGRVLPMGTTPARADEWLAPSFPLDWHTDLVEVLDLVARTGAADARMQPALDHLAATQLPGGGWPLLRAFWPPRFPALEPRSARRPSRLATRRVLDALDPLGGVPSDAVTDHRT